MAGARRQARSGKDPARLRSAEKRRELLVEPEVLEAPAVVDAVDHGGEPFNVRLPTGRRPRVVDDGPSRLRKKSVGGASSPIRRLLPLRNPLS